MEQRKEVPQYWKAIVEILSQVVSMPQLLPSTFPLPFYMEIRSHYSSAQIRLMASILFPIKNCVFSHSVMSDSFATPWTVAYQASLSMGFSRQEYWNQLPFPSLGDLPRPGIEPTPPATREALSFI